MASEERCKQLVDYLQGVKHASHVYPPGFTANEKRAFRQQAAIFEETDGVLFHISKGKDGEKILRRVVANTSEQQRLIRACHDGIDGGHFGRDKTLSKVYMFS